MIKAVLIRSFSSQRLASFPLFGHSLILQLAATVTAEQSFPLREAPGELDLQRMHFGYLDCDNWLDLPAMVSQNELKMRVRSSLDVKRGSDQDSTSEAFPSSGRNANLNFFVTSEFAKSHEAQFSLDNACLFL